MKRNSKDTKTDFHIKGYLPPHSDTSRDPTYNLRYFKTESNPKKSGPYKQWLNLQIEIASS